MKRTVFAFVLIGILLLLATCTKKEQFSDKLPMNNVKQTTIVSHQNENNFEVEVPLNTPRTIELTNPRMNGDDILELQSRLLSLGFVEIGEADGYYGPLMEEAIKNIQMAYGFEANGKVDRALWGFLFLDKNLWTPVNESDFEIDDNGIITAYLGKSVIVVIPPRINGIQVTGIGGMGNGAFADKGLKYVVIPDGVTKISYYDPGYAGAFQGNQLNTVTIPNSVTYIAACAFDENPLTTVNIGANVNLVNTEMYRFGVLAAFPVDFIDFYNFFGRKAGSYVCKDGIWGIYEDGNFAAYKLSENGYTINRDGVIIAYDGNDKELVIPDQVCGIGVRGIYRDVFPGKGLKSVVIPSGITSIGTCAFQDNPLTTIIIGANVNLMAFMPANDAPNLDPYVSFSTDFDYNCYRANGGKAGKYEYGSDVWSLNGETLYYTKTENGFTIDSDGIIITYTERDNPLVIPSSIGGVTVKDIKGYVFGKKGITSVTIPDSITAINCEAFIECQLTTITIGANVRWYDGHTYGYDNNILTFMNGFITFYNENGKKAGTYTHTSGQQWKIK